MAVSIMYKQKKSKKYSTYEMWLWQIFLNSYFNRCLEKKLFSFTFMPGIIPMKCCQYPFIYLDELPLFPFFINPPNIP